MRQNREFFVYISVSKTQGEKTMKRTIIAVILAAIMMLALVACNDSGNDASVTESSIAQDHANRWWHPSIIVAVSICINCFLHANDSYAHTDLTNYTEL